MTHQIIVKEGRKQTIHDVTGIRELHETLVWLREQGMRISTIKRIAVK